MVGEAPEPGILEPGLPSLADGLAPSLVLVVGADVTDPGVQPHPVVVRADDGQLRSQHLRIVDGQQVRVLGLEVSEERFGCGSPEGT
jgi:hypothetical protein